MYLLPKTCLATNFLKSSWDFFSGNSTWVPSISGKPTEGGVSGSMNQRTIAITIAMAAGTKKHNRQVGTNRFPLTRNPQRRTMRMLPMLCDEFQMENFVASCFGGNQFAMSRAQGG